jgi:hypothetical protein
MLFKQAVYTVKIFLHVFNVIQDRILALYILFSRISTAPLTIQGGGQGIRVYKQVRAFIIHSYDFPI